MSVFKKNVKFRKRLDFDTMGRFIIILKDREKTKSINVFRPISGLRIENI